MPKIPFDKFRRLTNLKSIMIPFKQFRKALGVKRYKKLAMSHLKDRPVGDCFKANCKLLHDELSNVPDARLVHAYVNGGGKLKGIRHPHAWVEIGDVVLDHSGGKKRVIRSDVYHAIGGVRKEPGEYASYSAEEAYKKLLKHRHWGPWDLKED